MDIKGRVAVVTGGAMGLGGASVEALAAAGAKVVILDINEEAAKAQAAKFGDNAVYAKFDLGSEADADAGIKLAMDSFGRIDILLNNAAYVIAEKTADKKKGAHNLENFKKVVAANLVGAFNMTRQAAVCMMQNEGDADGAKGVIINTSSVAAFDGQIGQVSYSATKGAINAMTLTIARELSSEGIRCVTICPGLFLTPGMSQLPDNVRQVLEKGIPFPQRLGHMYEFANLVKLIVETNYLNGEIIRLDGAIRMPPR